MLLCLLILKMILLSWFSSKNCLRIPVVMVPCSVWKLKWTKKMVLGKQGLKMSLSISGCPSSSCRGQMFGNKEKSNSSSVSKRTCTVNVVQVLTKKLTAWELSLFPLTEHEKRLHVEQFHWFLKYFVTEPKSTANDQPALHKSSGLYARTWVVGHQWKCCIRTSILML